MRKTDYIIIAVVLAVIVCGVLLFLRGGAEKTKEAPAAAVQAKTVTYSDYNGKKIGILTGSSFEPVTLEKFPDSEYLYFDSTSDLDLALTSGKIDGFLQDEPAAVLQKNENGSISYLDEKIVTEDYAFGFAKNRKGDKLLSEFNAFLAKLKADGELDKLKEKWTGADDSARTVDAPPQTGKNGSILVAVLPDLPPFSYTSNNQLSGYAVDLATRFAEEYGYSLTFEQTNTSALIAGVASGKYDFFAGAGSVTEERKQSMNFSDPVYSGGMVLVVRAEDTGGGRDASGGQVSAAAFNGKTAGIITGSMHDEIIKKTLPDSQMLEFNSYPDAAAAASAGRIDFFLIGAESADELVAENTDLDYIKTPLDKLDVGAMFPKTEKADKIREQFDEFIKKIYADGTRDKIYDYWKNPDIGDAYVDLSGLTGENGTLVLATCADEMPLTYVADNQIAGADPDIAARFCREYGYKLDVQIVDFGGLIPGLNSGIYDFAMSDVVITDERKESVNFSVPYNVGYIQLVARKDELGEGDGSGGGTSFIGSLKDSFNKNFVREDRWKLIVEGIGTTCLITALSVVFGSVLAFLICLFRRADSLLAGKICDFYVKLLQGTPMVVMLMILYYVVFGKSGLSSVWVAVVGFSLNFGAYVSEILRSGIESIDGGQREAALALGYSENQAFFRFIFPQAAVRQMPVYRGEMISMLKNTSIVGYIAIQDLTKMSDIIRSRTYEAFFPLIVTAVIYFIIAWFIGFMMKMMLKAVDPKQKKRRVKGVVTAADGKKAA